MAASAARLLQFGEVVYFAGRVSSIIAGAGTTPRIAARPSTIAACLAIDRGDRQPWPGRPTCQKANPAVSSCRALDRHKPPVDDDPSARDVGTVDAQAPHRQAALGPADRRRDPDRHRLVERFEDPDQSGSPASTNAAQKYGGAYGRSLSPPAGIAAASSSG